MKKIIILIIPFLLLSQIVFSRELNQTAAESSGFTRLTRYDEMAKYLKTITSKKHGTKLKVIGKSVEDRELYAIFMTSSKEFASQREKKPIVLIYCQQHGNEPSGKEAALILIRELLTTGKYLLKNLDLILVPQVNADGGERDVRKNANGMDLNRNHAILSEPESMALHQLFLDWLPEVTLDVHEFNAVTKNWLTNGIMKDADVMIDGVTNLCISEEITAYARNKIIPETGTLINAKGFRFHRYTVGSPFENSRMRHSTTAINDGRQSMGIYNTLSFILEGKRYGDVSNEIERRTKSQLAALLSFLETINKHSGEIIRIVRNGRAKLHKQPLREDVFIRQDYFPDPQNPLIEFPIFDLFKWQHTIRAFENYEPLVKPILSVPEPAAYLFSAKLTGLKEILEKHRIEFRQEIHDSPVEAEGYLIKHLTEITEEDKSSVFVDVRVYETKKDFPEGVIIIPIKQNARLLLPLLLEPQSTWSLCTENSGRKYRLKDYLKPGNEYPIYRLKSDR